MVTVNIAVLDFCSGCIKMYSQDFKEGWQIEDVEEWLKTHTDYKSSQCEYMCTEDEIEIIYPEVEE